MPKRIAPPFDVKSFMEQGEQFHYNMLLIGNKGNDEFPMLVAPFVTCAAFALEVYLKVLANIERGLMPLWTHHLVHLFNDVSPASQKRMEDEWTAKHLPGMQRHQANPKLPKDFPKIQSFRQALDMSALAFTDWRYAPRSKNRSFHLPDLVPIARQVIIDARPDLSMRTPRMERFGP